MEDAESCTGRRSLLYYCIALAVFAAGDAGFLLAFISHKGMLAGDPTLAHILAGGEDPMLVGFVVSFTSIAAALAIVAYAYLLAGKEF